MSGRFEVPIVEREIEEYLVKQVKRAGGLCYKFTSGVRGVPDRIVIAPTSGVFFVELKRPKEKERKLQVYVQEQMRKHGARVYSSVDSREKIDEIIRREFQHGQDNK